MLKYCMSAKYQAMTLISLRIRAVWPESLLGTLWIAVAPKHDQADSKDSDQRAWKRRVIWDFAGRTYNSVYSLGAYVVLLISWAHL